MIDKILENKNVNRLIVTATLTPVTGERFQPTGFPDHGHCVYDAVDAKGKGTRVCIVDSSASMANHLEKVCKNGAVVHPDLAGLPRLVCMTSIDGKEVEVMDSLGEAHRIGADYFLEGTLEGTDRTLRDVLEEAVGAVATKKKPKAGKGKKPKADAEKKDETEEEGRSIILPSSVVKVNRFLFEKDPNCVLHGVWVSDPDIRMSRILTATMDATNVGEITYTGVKFDVFNQTKSVQAIFPVKEKTGDIEARFVIDIDRIRSLGLKPVEQKLLLGLALWKIRQLTAKPYRYRTKCDLKVRAIVLTDDNGASHGSVVPDVDIASLIKDCKFATVMTVVHRPASKLFANEKKKEESDTPPTTE